MLPPGLGVALGLLPETVLIVMQGDEFTLRSGTGGALGLPRVAANIAARRAAGAECVLQLAAAQGLVRQAHIAHAALSRGVEAFSGEIERQTPFAPDQVYLGYTAEAALDPRGRVLTRFAVAPCAGVEAVLHRLAGFGIVPDRITLQDATDPTAAGVTVRRLAQAPRRLPKMLMLGSGLLFAVALASPFLHNRIMLSAIQSELAALRDSATTGADRRQDQSDAQARLGYLTAQRNARPPVVAVLEAISGALPDSAHIVQFNLSGNELSLQGGARSASSLIAPLEALPMVAEVGFAAPVLRDPAADNEQYQMLIKLRQTAKDGP